MDSVLREEGDPNISFRKLQDEPTGADLVEEENDDVEELRNSLKEIVQDQAVKPKLQCLMVDPSFSMVTVQSEDSGIVWETVSSRCSTPWASDASTTSDAYSLEGSGTQGKIIIIMDEEKIMRKRKKTRGRSKPGDRFKRPSSKNFPGGNERPFMTEVSVPNVRPENTGDNGEPKDDKEQQLFSIVAEGYEILNIIVPSKLPTVDEEESTEMTDNLSYLVDTPKIKSSSKLGPTMESEIVEAKEPEPKTEQKDEENPKPARKDGTSDMDYFEKFTLLDEHLPGDLPAGTDEQTPASEPTGSEPLENYQQSKDEASASEDAFVFVSDGDMASELFDEVFYGIGSQVEQEDSMDGKHLQEEDEEDQDASGTEPVNSLLKESGSALFGSQETILTPIFLSPGPPKIVDQALLDEPTAMSFHYTDLYEEAVGERKKDQDASDVESVVSEKSFQRRLSDSDDQDGYLEKFTLKDETPVMEDEPTDEEAEEDGIRLWPQSKFELTGFLTHAEKEDVITKGEEGSEQNSQPSPNEDTEETKTGTEQSSQPSPNEGRKVIKTGIEQSSKPSPSEDTKVTKTGTEQSSQPSSNEGRKVIKTGIEQSSEPSPSEDTKLTKTGTEQSSEPSPNEGMKLTKTGTEQSSEPSPNEGRKVIKTGIEQSSEPSPSEDTKLTKTDIEQSSEPSPNEGMKVTKTGTEQSSEPSPSEDTKVTKTGTEQSSQPSPNEGMKVTKTGTGQSSEPSPSEDTKVTKTGTEQSSQPSPNEGMKVTKTGTGQSSEPSPSEGTKVTKTGTEETFQTQVEVNEKTVGAKSKCATREHVEDCQNKKITKPQTLSQAAVPTTEDVMEKTEERVLGKVSGNIHKETVSVKKASQSKNEVILQEPKSTPQDTVTGDKAAHPETQKTAIVMEPTSMLKNMDASRKEVQGDKVGNKNMGSQLIQEWHSNESIRDPNIISKRRGQLLRLAPLVPAEVIGEEEVEEQTEERAAVMEDISPYSPLRGFSLQKDLTECGKDPLDFDDETAEELGYEMITQQEALLPSGSEGFWDKGLLHHANEALEEEEYEIIEAMDGTVTPETEPVQRDSKNQAMDTFCLVCRCPIVAISKLHGEHRDHEVSTLDEAYDDIRCELSEWISALQERSEKIEDFVSELELAYNSVEEQCQDSERSLDEHHEEVLKMVMDQYNEMSQCMEEEKKVKLEQLYDQIVSFQEKIDSAKETLERATQEMEETEPQKLQTSFKDINARQRAALESCLSLELTPSAFPMFEDYSKSSSGAGRKEQKGIAIPQKPHLQTQETNSATSTSVTVYWKVNEGDVIDCFQVYCMEEPQRAVSEEYRVTVKESYCTLEDLDPDRSYKVWVMAVNYAGCSLPSEKMSFRTAPSVPVIDTGRCTVCWDCATIRWSTAHQEAVENFTLEYCRQYACEGEGLRSISGIRGCEQWVLLHPNENYLFYIRALNSAGASDQSEATLISTRGTRFHLLKDTADSGLELSEDMTTVRCNTESFSQVAPTATQCLKILGELLPPRGRHYWETWLGDSEAFRIGVACPTAPCGSLLENNSASWCLRCIHRSGRHSPFSLCDSSCRFELLHNSLPTKIYVGEGPSRIGTLLDFTCGRLSFFNAQSGQLLASCQHPFARGCHPVLAFEEPGTLELCAVSEVPEFAKYC